MGVENVATVWDADTGQKLLTVSGDSREAGYGIAFSPDGKRLATLDTGQVVVWDATNGQRLLSLPGKSIGQTINHLSFSPDGQRLAVANMDGVPKVWNLATTTEVISLTGHTALCDGIAYSPDGTRLVTTGWDGTARVWDVVSGRAIVTFTSHLQPGQSNPPLIGGVAFNPAGRHIFTGGADGYVREWDAATGQCTGEVPHRGEEVAGMHLLGVG